MSRFLKLFLLIVAGTLLLWCLTVTLQAMAGEGPDRNVGIQAPLGLLVLGAPILSWLLRARRERLSWPLLVAQLGCYVLYETGISIETNIRIDVFLLYPAILLNAWILFRPARPSRSALPAWARRAGCFGLVVAMMGLLGSAVLLVTPPLLASYTASLGTLEDHPPIYATPEAWQAAYDKAQVPSWFRPYFLGTGAAGLLVSCFFFWGAWQLLRSAPRGPERFMLGAILFMVVATCIALAGLVSSRPMVRAPLIPTIGLLAVTGILLMLVRRGVARRQA